MEDERLIQRLSALSSRLELSMREFAEHGALPIETDFKHDASTTEQVLFERFLQLLRDLDGEILKRINEEKLGDNRTESRTSDHDGDSGMTRGSLLKQRDFRSREAPPLCVLTLMQRSE
jgi:hypothetical protein